MTDVLMKLSPFRNNRRVLRYSQSVGDIMSGILETHKKYAKEYDLICTKFDGPTAEIIAHKVYNFLKRHTFYVVEADTKQTLRSPAAILALGANPKVGLDCKSYSLFIGGILDAFKRRGKKIDWCYRFASYKLIDKVPHHVFVVLNPGTNNEIWVDPVLPSFNNKKQYNYKIDKKINMALIAVAGIGKTKRTNAEKAQRRAELKAKVKDRIKKSGKLLLKFNPATAGARNAILLVIKVNLFGLAHKLFQMIRKPNGETKLKKFWESIGGRYASLTKNIMEGVKHGKHKGEDKILSEIKSSTKTTNGPIQHAHKKPRLGMSIGDPVTASAVVASTPILIKLITMLKDMGIDTDKLQAAAKDVLKKAVNDKIDKFANDKANKEEGNTNTSYNSEGVPVPEGDSVEGIDENFENESVEGIPTNKLLIGTAIVGGAYLLLKKK